jgi:hypothetical protein
VRASAISICRAGEGLIQLRNITEQYPDDWIGWNNRGVFAAACCYPLEAAACYWNASSCQHQGRSAMRMEAARPLLSTDRFWQVGRRLLQGLRAEDLDGAVLRRRLDHLQILGSLAAGAARSTAIAAVQGWRQETESISGLRREMWGSRAYLALLIDDKEWLSALAEEPRAWFDLRREQQWRVLASLGNIALGRATELVKADVDALSGAVGWLGLDLLARVVAQGSSDNAQAILRAIGQLRETSSLLQAPPEVLPARIAQSDSEAAVEGDEAWTRELFSPGEEDGPPAGGSTSGSPA